jgi:hypothetical protein
MFSFPPTLFMVRNETFGAPFCMGGESAQPRLSVNPDANRRGVQ